MQAFDLTGQVAVVTGGNSGIGLGMARGLVQAGAQVCIWGTNPERTTSAAEELSVDGEKVLAMIVDVGEEDAVVAAMAEVVDRFGHLDACFANAGLGSAETPLLDTTLADFHRITRVNLDGAFVTLREAARRMVDGGRGGSLVATSSMGANFGQARGYAYTAANGGLLAIVKALAVELARYRIRANALMPGWTESGATGPLFDNKKFAANVMPRMPVRRWGTGQDFAGIAVYLASTASSFHTGDAVLIDGGYSAF